MIDKVCVCGEKDPSCFKLNRRKCNNCLILIRKNYYWNNREKLLAKNKKWRNDNKDRYSKKRKETNSKNRSRIRGYEKQYYLNNPPAKLAKNLRIRIKDFFKGHYKPESAVKILGCSVDSLKLYLESKFQPGMSWDNYGIFGWHIDHIVPLSKFDLNDMEQFKIACHYTNLQPMWSKDNWSKGNRA